MSREGNDRLPVKREDDDDAGMEDEEAVMEVGMMIATGISSRLRLVPALRDDDDDFLSA